ncbi:MAG TPA: histone [archaeon]|nr:histone [archaeon]
MPFPLASIERIAKNAGVDRIGQDAVKEIDKILEEIGEELVRDAAKAAEHAKRNTIMKEDIILVSGKQPA